MSDDGPSFAFVFRDGLGQPLPDLAEADVAAGNANFIWVHLDLRDAAAQAWLSRRPWPPDVVEKVAAPIQRGRLFITPDLVYGHLRDFATSPVLPPWKRAHSALSPPGRSSSPVDAFAFCPGADGGSPATRRIWW